MDSNLSIAAKFFNNVAKSDLANFVALTAIYKSHGLDTTALEESFISYQKQINTLKQEVRKQLEQTELVDDTLSKLKVKVKGL